MAIYVADAHAHVQRLVSVVKMATVLEEYTTEDSVLLCVFIGKLFISKDIHKEMSPVYVETYLSVMRFHLGGKRFADDKNVETEV
jgi:hypothetical protein